MQHPDLVLLFGACMTGFSFLALLKWCVPDASPFGLVWRFAREHAVSKRSLFYLLTLLSILFFNILETKYDDLITHHLRWDFTGLFLQIEGSATALFQMVHPTWLTYIFASIYLYVFPVLGLVAVLVSYHGGERDLGRKLFWGMVFNYVLIIPFYILVPVSERWAAGDGEVVLLMNSISPLLIEGLRPLSGLNNCFPSFHCSLAVTFMMLVSQSANRRLRKTMVVLTAAVVMSTLYLGFHWVLDVFGGVVFAAVCTLLATWAVENLRLELVLYRTR